MLFMVISSFLFGLSYPLASVLIGEIDPLEFSFYFLSTLVVIQLPFVLWRWREVARMTLKKEFGLMIVAGMIGSFLYWCEFSSLKVGLPVAHLTFISLTVPAWALLYEYFRGRGTGWNLNKWMIALVGSAFLVTPGADGTFSIDYLLPIVTSLLMAGWLIYSKKCQEAGISPLVNSFFNDLFSLIGIGAFICLKGRLDTFSFDHNFGNIAIYAVLIGLLPGLLFLYGLRHMDLVPAATIIMLEPLITGVVAVVAANEVVTLNLLAGAILVVASNLPDNTLAYLRRVTVLYALNSFR